MILNSVEMYLKHTKSIPMRAWLAFAIVSISLAHAKENQTQPDQVNDDQQGSTSNHLPAFTSGFSAFSPVTFPGATTESIQPREYSGFGSLGGDGFGSDFFKNALDSKETTPSGPEGRTNQGFGNGFSNDFFKSNTDRGETTPSSAPDSREGSGFGQEGFSSDFYKSNVDTEETTLPVSSLAPRNGTNGTDAEAKDYGHSGHSGYGHEKCHTSYKTVYKTVYETSYKKKCHTTYDKKCHTEYYTTYKKKCHTSYSKKCSTSYKTVYKKKCKVHYDHKVSSNDPLIRIFKLINSMIKNL